MEGELRDDAVFWGQFRPGVDEVVQWESRRQVFKFPTGQHARMKDVANLEPIPTRDELRELREKARLYDELRSPSVTVSSVRIFSNDKKPHINTNIDPRKATP